MSEQLDTSQTENTPDYKAMYEASNAEKEKISGQYKSLQKKHSTANKTEKESTSNKNTEFDKLQVKYDALEKKSTDSSKKTLLSQIKTIDSKLAKENAESDVGTLETVLKTAIGMKSGFPSHDSKTGAEVTKNPLDPGTYDPKTGTWK